MGPSGKRGLSAETLAVQALGDIDPQSGGVVPPIDIAVTYQRDFDNGYSRGFVYGRPDNATVRRAEKVVAALEGAPAALLFGSGMAAATTAFLALERPAHVIAPHVMYWSLRRWLAQDAPGFGIQASFVDATDLAAIKEAVRPGETKMIWIETPANPLWILSDIAAVANIAHEAGALLAVDSTVATPVLSQPIALGADLIMHSATKYLNGHSDVLAGALVPAQDDAYTARLAAIRANLGAVLGPYEGSLLLRGLRTLHVRVRQQCLSAMALAEFLGTQPQISEVLYPGLSDHPQHALAQRQMKDGFGAMLSVRLAGGEPAAVATAARLAVFKRATSLGGVESLVEHRASIEGPDTPCPRDLLRLSIGLETIEDLKCDWTQALNAL